MLDYKQIVGETLEIIGNYKRYIESEDLLSLEKTKNQLVANKALLRSLYHDTNRLYLNSKDKYEKTKAEKYRDCRNRGDNTLDATNFARLECIPYSEAMHDLQCKRDKCKGLIDDIPDVIIGIATAVRDAKQDVKYG